MRPMGRLRDGLIALTALLPPQTVMAEIGSYAGESAEIFLESGRVATIYCVDRWEDYRYGDGSEKLNASLAEAAFDRRMSFYGGMYSKLKMDSARAAQTVSNHSLDFVYIDGGHSYSDVRDDIRAWLPKIKRNGAIGGHDYVLCELPHYAVKAAVDDIFGAPDETFEDDSWLVWAESVSPHIWGMVGVEG